MFTAELISRILEQITNVKIQLWNLGFVESVSEFDIAGTGAVYIKAYEGTLCFSSPMLGVTIRDEGRRQRCYKQR